MSLLLHLKHHREERSRIRTDEYPLAADRDAGDTVETSHFDDRPYDNRSRFDPHDNARLLALSGPRSPYQGKLGVVETGALADLLLVEGNPLIDIDVISDPQKNFNVIMKDGVIYKSDGI